MTGNVSKRVLLGTILVRLANFEVAHCLLRACLHGVTVLYQHGVHPHSSNEIHKLSGGVLGVKKQHQNNKLQSLEKLVFKFNDP